MAPSWLQRLLDGGGRRAAEYGLFVSYRRADASGHAGRLCDRLTGHFGAHCVFQDVEDIEAGRDFVQAIEEAMDGCEALLVVIGPRWLTLTDPEGRRRLDDPSDFIRLEVATGLRRNVRVVPVLVGGATMPPADRLPDDLQSLARRQAHELSDTRWRTDVDALMESLETLPGLARAAERKRKEKKKAEGGGWSPLTGVLPWLKRHPVMGAGVGFVMLASVAYSAALESGWIEDPSVVEANLPPYEPSPDPDPAPREEEPVKGSPVQEPVQRPVAESPREEPVQRPVAQEPVIETPQQQPVQQQAAVLSQPVAEELLQAAPGEEVEASELEAFLELLQSMANAGTETPVGVANVAGFWEDAYGNAYIVQQAGAQVEITQMSLGVVVAQAAGTVQGQVVSFQYQSVSDAGTGQLQLSPDGTALNGAVVSSYTGVQTPLYLYR